MNTRLVVATVAVFALAVTAGCLGAGPSTEELQANQTYDWDGDATVTYEIDRGSIFGGDTARGVYTLDGEDEVVLYRRGITRTRPVSIESVQFRHPNGTVESYDEQRFEVERTDRETRVVAPADEGQVGITIDNRARSLRVASNINGSYEVILPPDHQATDLLLGDVSPRGYETEQRGDQQIITWDDLDSGQTVIVRYYLTRDRLLFYGVGAGLVVVAGGIVLYYRRKLEALRRQREEHGLDVDQDEYDDDEPPPGFG